MSAESAWGDASAALCLTDANGTVYLAEPAGAWDAPSDDDRSGVYYEDEERPAGAVPLYRLTLQREEPASVVDLMDALDASLAAARATLSERRRSDSDPPAGERPGTGDAPPAAPSGGEA